MSPANSPQPRRYFIDRSLGRYDVPGGLRAAGVDVVVIADHYGERRAQEMPDEEWLRDVRAQGWIVLTKDTNLTRVQANGQPSKELAALVAADAVVFCIMSGNLSAADQLERFLRYWRRIENIVNARRGPLVYGLYHNGLREIWPG